MTPYRSAARAKADEVVLCPHCAERVFCDGEAELRCRSCSASFAAQRADAALCSEVELTEADLSGHTELRAAAAAFGRDQDCARLVFHADGLPVVVGLVIDSGSARGVDYSASTRGLPHIVLRREDYGDVDAKESGVAREVQTGDEGFDRAVYIESEAADEDVLAVLRPEGVREAIVAVLKHVPRVALENGTVSAKDDATPECYSAERIGAVVSALRVIAGAPRRTKPAELPAPTLGRTLTNLVYFLLPLGIGAIWFGCVRFPPVSYGTLVLVGGLCAVVVAAFLQPLLTRAVRGTSTAHRDLIPLRAVSFVGMIVLGIGLSILLNGALDRSAPWTEDGVVESAEHDRETNSTSVGVRTKSRSVEYSVYDTGNEVLRGHAARLFLRGGAFGQPWKTQPAIVTAGATAVWHEK